MNKEAYANRASPPVVAGQLPLAEVPCKKPQGRRKMETHRLKRKLRRPGTMTGWSGGASR